MNREQAKEWLPIIQAWAEGKQIQYQVNPGSGWIDINKGIYTSNPPSHYRIRPESKYRPFKNQEECWQEIHKHSNFGWIRYKDSICAIQNIAPEGITMTDGIKTSNFYFEECLENTKFADGTPFGIKYDDYEK